MARGPFSRIGRVLSQEGPAGLVNRVRYRVRFRRAGVDFAPEELPAEVATSDIGRHAHVYRATSVHLVRFLTSKCTGPAANGLTDGSFVDLGCGKGGPVYAAELIGFRRCLGVEYVDRFADIARENFRKLGTRRCEIVVGDATRFAFPSDLRVLFMFNPFDDVVMEATMRNLLPQMTRPVFVIYAYAKHRDVLERMAPGHRIVFEDPETNDVVYEIGRSG